LLILSVYAVIWLCGLYASLVALPHRLEPAALRVRYGLFNEATIPYDRISKVEQTRRKTPKPGDGLQPAPEEDAVYLSVGGRTDVALRLTETTSVRGAFGRSAPALTLHLAADDPSGLVRALSVKREEGAESPAAPSGVLPRA
jgi:hypothetical protein